MAKMHGPVDVSAELAALRHEKQNQKMKRLPPHTTIQRRPLHHAPVASALAASHVPKVVYVSSQTPIMAAVKRVRKFLFEIEKRAIQSATAKDLTPKNTMEKLVEATDRLAKANEEVLVKASGRAMQQALRVGEWFRNKEKEMVCKVEVRTSSVQAVDDIVEAEVEVEESHEDAANEAKDDPTGTSTVLTGGETTMELLGDNTKSSVEQTAHDIADQEKDSELPAAQGASTRKRKRFRKKRAVYDEDDVPEARIRWVKTVEVAISLKT